MNRRNFLAKAVTASALAATTTHVTHRASAKPHTSKKLLLYSGWNTKNIGDQGHTPGTLRYLETYYPQLSVTLWIRYTNEDITRILKRRFSTVDILQGKIDKQGIADNPALQQALDQADLFIQNSGMHYNSFWKPGHLPATLNRLNKPYCLYAQSFDGFQEEDKARMVPELSKAAAIYGRDTDSFYYLRSIGVKSDILEFGPDGCFGIDLHDDPRAEAYLEKHDLEPKKFIIVTIRTNTPYGEPDDLISKKGDTPDWHIGDDSQFPFNPTKEDAEEDERWASTLREVIGQWVKATGLKVLLAPEVKKEIIHARRLIYDKLPPDIQSHVVHKSEWWNMDEACSVFKRCHTVVATEPHSCIMALANRTPILHLFSERHGLKAWMFRDIGLPEWLMDIDKNPASIPTQALLEIHGDYERAQAKVDRSMAFVEKRSSEMIADLKRIVESSKQK